MDLAIHHLHHRKRIYQKHEKFPSPNKWKRLLDIIVYIAGIFGPLMMFPQILKIYLSQDATSLSIITWIANLAGALLLFVYSISHKERPLIIMYTLWICVHATILIGIILYG